NAKENAKINAKENAKINAKENAKINAKENAKINAKENTKENAKINNNNAETKENYHYNVEKKNNNNESNIENVHKKKSTEIIKNIIFIKENILNKNNHYIDNKKNIKHNNLIYCHSKTTPTPLKSKRNVINRSSVRFKRSMSVSSIINKNKLNYMYSNNNNVYDNNFVHVSKKNLKKELRKNKTDSVFTHMYKNFTRVHGKGDMVQLMDNILTDTTNHTYNDYITETKTNVDKKKENNINNIEGVPINSKVPHHLGTNVQLENSSDLNNLKKNELDQLDQSELEQLDQNELEKLYQNSNMYKYIKLCDFNTSIKLKENYKYISYVCSRYYRAPELLFGSNYYSQAIDTWSIGCVMGELLLGKPLFLGECASDQLVEIIKILGTPNDEDFLSFRSIYKNVKFPDVKPITLKKLIKYKYSHESIDLLDQLLQFNPKKRIKLCNALLHEYFDDIRSLKVFMNKDNYTDSPNFDKIYLPSITNCFNFTKEELLHFTVAERKLLVPSEIRKKKLYEVIQYINMPLDHFDKLYPDKLHLTC
ncbi:protein kinase 1, putative, partial [Hepatocystis sp. ex Piliocolobus tephrosceles]